MLTLDWEEIASRFELRDTSDPATAAELEEKSYVVPITFDVSWKSRKQIILTGARGSGKSTFLRIARTHWQLNKRTVFSTSYRDLQFIVDALREKFPKTPVPAIWRSAVWLWVVVELANEGTGKVLVGKRASARDLGRSTGMVNLDTGEKIARFVRERLEVLEKLVGDVLGLAKGKDSTAGILMRIAEHRGLVADLIESRRVGLQIDELDGNTKTRGDIASIGVDLAEGLNAITGNGRKAPWILATTSAIWRSMVTDGHNMRFGSQLPMPQWTDKALAALWRVRLELDSDKRKLAFDESALFAVPPSWMKNWDDKPSAYGPRPLPRALVDLWAAVMHHVADKQPKSRLDKIPLDVWRRALNAESDLVLAELSVEMPDIKVLLSTLRRLPGDAITNAELEVVLKRIAPATASGADWVTWDIQDITSRLEECGVLIRDEIEKWRIRKELLAR